MTSGTSLGNILLGHLRIGIILTQNFMGTVAVHTAGGPLASQEHPFAMEAMLITVRYPPGMAGGA